MITRFVRLVAALTVALAAAAPAAAQDRLFHYGYELGAIGRFGERIGPANGLDHRLAGGGRFIVPTLEGETDVVDRRTGARRSLPAAASVLSVDPARPRLILAVPGTGPVGTRDLAVFDVVTGLAEVVIASACGGPLGLTAGPAAYAYDAQLIVGLRCSAPQVVQDLVAVDVSRRPYQLRVLPFTPAADWFEVSSDGTLLFARASTGFLTAVVTAHDIDSGRHLGTAGPGDEIRGTQWDDALDALLVFSGWPYAESIVTVYSRSLARLATAVFSSALCSARVQVSPHTGRIYVTRNGASSNTSQPVVVDVFAGTPLRLVDRGRPSPEVTPSCEGAFLRTAPGAPRHLTATVTGRDVSLDWRNVGGASGFVLEAGLAPGRTDVSLSLGPDSSVTIPAVPPGTYYVRVRGGNEFGGGRPSQEIRVVVP